MKSLFKKSVPASELPPKWREEGRFAPEDRVSVCVEPDDPKLAAAESLTDLMDMIGRRAQARGLTEEKLESILHE